MKLALGPQNVLVQAQRHARGFAGGPFSFHGFRLPFVYSTNGEIFWFQDLRELQSRSHQVAGFPHLHRRHGGVLRADGCGRSPTWDHIQDYC